MPGKNFSRYNMRCGIVLRAQKGGMKLNGFDIPELDNRFLLISASDIEGENRVNAMGTELPLLASDTIDYPGQPLLVLFGPDYEGAELEIEKIKVLASPIEEGEKSEDQMLFYSWGLDEVSTVEEEKQKLKKTDTWLTVGHGLETRPVRYDMIAWTDPSGAVNIEGPMQWTSLVKDTVSRVTGKLPGAIILHPLKYHAAYDEYFLDPAFLAAYVAIAAIRTKLHCEIREDSIFSRPGIECHLTTWTDAEDKPRHEEIDITVDQGAYQVGAEELRRQIMTGLIPKYDVASFKCTIRTETSRTVPAIFCGSLGYSTASAARSLHAARLASRTGTTPLSFLSSTTMTVTRFTDYAAHYDTRDMIGRAKRTASESDFLRKWTSSHLQKGEFGLAGYRTGVGISTDMGISGFSNTYARNTKYQGAIAYTTKRHLAFSGSIPASITQDKSVRDLLSSILATSDYTDTLMFVEDNEETPDTGPNVLSLYGSQLVPRLAKALAKITSLTKVQEPPFSMSFTTQDTTLPCEFLYSGHGAAVCEVVLEKITLVPVVKHLWLNLSLETAKAKGTRQRAKNAAKEALGAIGAKVAHDFQLTLELTERNEDLKTYSSIEGTVGCLVTGAYVSAIWQAVGEKSSITIPASATQIERTLNGGGSEN